MDRKKFEARAFLASVFFVACIILSVVLFVIADKNTLTVPRIVNISSDIFCMTMGYVLFICCTVDISKNEENLNYYLLLLFTTFFSAFLDEFAWLVDGNSALVEWNLYINTFYHITIPLLAYLFWRYTISFLDLDYKHVSIMNHILSAGLLAAEIMRVANMWTGLYFTIDDLGTYNRGPLYLLSNLFSYLTMIVTIAVIFIERKRLRKIQIITFVMYVLFPLCIGILTISVYGLNILSAAIMIVMLLMYCVLNVNQNRDRFMADSELHMATTIQMSMLPRKFPAFPDRKEFDLYASMTPAKEVGGDFYDFFLTDDDHLVITMADVSGKGVPAALFMMVVKTLMKNQYMTDASDVGKILSRINDQLCEKEGLEMFVTAWTGVLTISTGELRYANAGHEYPAIKRKDGSFAIIKERHFPPIATMAGLPFKEQRIFLDPGDIIYLYTDGVTEAINHRKEMYGTDRMLAALDQYSSGSMEDLDRDLRKDMDTFIDGAAQFDDITMLSLKYSDPLAEVDNNSDEKE